MKHSRKTYMLLVVLIIIFSNLTLESKAQLKIWSLRTELRYLDKELDDTVKYDFLKTYRYNPCMFKHSYNATISTNSLLRKINLKLKLCRFKGIGHSDYIPSIITESFFRYLNNEPIKFREQKGFYKKTYKKRKNSGYTDSEIDDINNKHRIQDSINQIKILDLYYIGRKIRGDFEVSKETGNGVYTGKDIKYIGQVIEKKGNSIIIQVLEREKIEDGYSFSNDLFPNFSTYVEVNDTIEINPCSVYLIPD